MEVARLQSFNVFFYANSGTLPGATQIYPATGQSYVNAAGVFQVTLTAPGRAWDPAHIGYRCRPGWILAQVASGVGSLGRCRQTAQPLGRIPVAGLVLPRAAPRRACPVSP